MYLRDFKEEYRILRNVSNPIIIAGLPLNLAFIYLGVILASIIIALIISSMNVGIIVNMVIPIAICFGGITAIKIFNTRFGLNGFHQTRKDFETFNTIEADLSIEEILNSKVKNEVK